MLKRIGAGVLGAVAVATVGAPALTRDRDADANDREYQKSQVAYRQALTRDEEASREFAESQRAYRQHVIEWSQAENDSPSSETVVTTDQDALASHGATPNSVTTIHRRDVFSGDIESMRNSPVMVKIPGVIFEEHGVLAIHIGYVVPDDHSDEGSEELTYMTYVMSVQEFRRLGDGQGIEIHRLRSPNEVVFCSREGEVLLAGTAEIARATVHVWSGDIDHVYSHEAHGVFGMNPLSGDARPRTRNRSGGNL